MLKKLVNKEKKERKQFPKKIEKNWINYKKIFFISLKILLFLIFPFLILILADFLTRLDINKVFAAINSNFVVYSFSYFLIFLVFSFLYVIIWRFSFFATAFLFWTLSLINHFKSTILDEPFYPSDIFIHSWASGSLLTFVKIKFDSVFIWAILVAIIFCTVLFFVFKWTKINKKLRIWVWIFLLLANSYIFFDNDFRVYWLQKTVWLNAEWLARRQKYNYDTNWFIAWFFVNIWNVNIKKPANYNEKTINDLVLKYSKIWEKKEIKKPNVIFILSEAFWDVTQLPGIYYSTNPTVNFNKIKKDWVYGNLISPTFWWKTALVEFEILTWNSIKYLPFWSIPYQQYIKKPIPSVVQEFKKNWYQTLALHTYEKKFFNRDEAYKYIWFDKYIWVEDLKNPKYKWPFVSDEEFTDQVITNFKNKDKNKPLFLFWITMQNHFTYEWEKYKNLEIKATWSWISDKSINMLNNYSQWVMDADKQLGRLVDFVKKQKEPTVIVFFWDHLGSMGENYYTYWETWLIYSQNDDNWSDKEKKKMYSTEFLIWDNYSKNKKNIWNIWATYLGNYLLDYVWLENKNPYFNYLSYEFDNCAVVNSKQLLMVKNWETKHNISDLWENCKNTDLTHQLFQYDILFGNNFLEKYK